MKVNFKAETAAHALLELLSLRGIDYFFANAGTDFASIVEAFADRKKKGKDRPIPIIVPHELPLTGMAQGYYLATGRPQAAMVHVNVGTANSVGGLMCARSAGIPIMFMAGRTPVTEEGGVASRSGQIHWGQESFDQASMVREYVKWDYELRVPSQIETVVDRALTMAMTEPRGPVYLSMPREVLYEPVGDVEFEDKPRFDLPTFHPDPSKVQEAADLLAGAQFPLIITSSAGRSLDSVKDLVDLAEAVAIGVVSFNSDFMNFPMDHPYSLGFSPAPVIDRADVILVLDCVVPWFPKVFKPRDSAKVIQAGLDPFHSTQPIRSFRSDLTLQGNPALILSAITRAVKKNSKSDTDSVKERHQELTRMHDKILDGWREEAKKTAKDSPLDFHWVSHNVDRVLGEDKIVLNEFNTAIKEQVRFEPGTFFGPPNVGYLGWAMGTALGVKLAEPDKTVVVTVGDGTYMFSVPSTCHQVSSQHQLPILTIVYDNGGWHAVKRATKSVHPDGVAAKTDYFALSDFEPTAPRLEKICEAFGGYGERVEDPDQVGPALERALHAVKVEKRQALLHVIGKRGKIMIP